MQLGGVGGEDAAAVVQLGRVDTGLALRGQGAAVVQFLAAAHADGGRIGCAVVIRHGGDDAAAVANNAVGVEADAAGLGEQLPGVLDAAAAVGADQGDFAGIHAAQSTGVDGDGGRSRVGRGSIGAT